MTSPFDGYEVEPGERPSPTDYDFDLERTLTAVVALEAQVPENAFTARTLGTERLGNGVVIGPNGLVLTIGYLVTEATAVRLTLGDGRRVAAHVLGFDAATGFGLVQALEPLDLPVLPLGNARALEAGAAVVVGGAGGIAHAAAGEVLLRTSFAGYWEYLLDDAIMTGPGHPHWSGAALIGAAGELLGVGSLSLQGQLAGGGQAPINMFVPIDLLPPILDDLARGRLAQPPRPWLGVYAQDVNSHVVLVDVSAGGPAARAELRSGDVILAVAGTPVSELGEFYTRMWACGAAGVRIPLKVQRDRDVFDLEVRSGDRGAMLLRPKPN